MTNSIGDLASADVVLLVGSNMTAAHPVIGMEVHNKGLRRGMKLIVIDPRRTKMARRADIHLQINPGTDVAILKAIMLCIVEEGLQDGDFIDRRTEGYDLLTESLSEMSLPEYARICGIPETEIRRAARLFASAGNASICYCLGITQHSHGVDNVRTIANLAMLTGNIGRPGVGVNPLRGANNVQGCCDMGGLPDLLPGYRKVEDEANRELFERAWGTPLADTKAGLTVTEMIDACLCRDMKAMYVMGENPVISDPDSTHVIEALKNLEFLVVQDIFLTETAELADVVLPGACFAEKDGTFTNTERRVQRVRKAVEPPGEARADWEIVRDVANMMGAGWKYFSPERIFDEARKTTVQYGGIEYGRLQRRGIQWPCPDESHPGTVIMHTDKFACGRGKMAAVDFRASMELPDDEYPFVFNTGRSLYHFHTGSMTRRSRGLDELVPHPLIDIHPEDAASLGVADGEHIKVTSRRGEISAAARVTDTTRQGSIFLPFHFREAAANILTNTARDPIAKIPELKVCAVRVEKV